MEISDVRVRLLTDSNDRLKAVCSVTLGEQFVIRDIKLVDGTGGLFVAMPSRKLSAPCPNCRTQNHLRARYCNECGKQVPAARIPKDDNGREKAHRDVAHPITAVFRQAIQDRVLEAYEEELGNGRSRDDSFENRNAEETAAPVEEKEVKKEVEEEKEETVDDYNSMIADLDPGRGRSRRKESHGPPPEQKSDRTGRRGRDSGHDRQRKDDRSSVERSEPSEKAASRVPAPSATSSAESVDRTDQDETAFGCGLDEMVKPPPAKRAAPKVEEKKPAPVDPAPPVEDTGDDDSGFGEGIL